MAVWQATPTLTIDVRDFGAKCDNSTDDTAAVQAAVNSVGDNTNYRAAEMYIPGLCAISDTILVQRQALNLRGVNWGSQSAGNPNYGSGFRWIGTVNTKPMLRLQQNIGTRISNLRFIGNTIAANLPTAGISFYRAASGESQPNTMNRVEHCWFGQLMGYDPTGIYLDAGILFEGANQNNDQSWMVDNVFYGCNTGVNQTGAQNVINHYQECRWQNCGTGLKTVAAAVLTNCYMYGSTVCDLNITGCDVHARGFNSESSKQLALIGGTSKLTIEGEYFQVTNSLNANGRIIDYVNDYGGSVELRNFDFRWVSYSNAATPVLAIKAVSTSAAVHKNLRLSKVTRDGGVPFPVTNLDVAIAGSGDDVILFGEQQGVADGSGLGTLQSFWNVLKSGQATASYGRDDRVIRPPVTLTDAATIATDASLSNTFRVTLGGNRTLGVPTNPTDGQRAVWIVTQDATGGRTLTLAGGTGGFVFGTDVTGVTLSTTANKADFIGAFYNSTANVWRVTAVARGY